MSQQVQGFCQSITGLSWPTAKPIDLIFLLTYKAATAKFHKCVLLAYGRYLWLPYSKRSPH